MSSVKHAPVAFEWELPRARTDVASYQLDDGLVVYDPENGQSYLLNATGRLVWSLCDGERSYEDIVGDVLARFDMAGEQISSDLTELMADLWKSNLLLDMRCDLEPEIG